MSTDYFIFGGVDTRTYNAKVFRPNVETVGPQLYTTHEIPGRNGDILLPKGRYPNRRERYSILCTGANAVQHMDDLKNALLYQTGYQRLTDSFDTDVYYQAALTDQFDIEYTRERDAAKCRITFNRKPQKFFVSGDSYTSIRIGFNDTEDLKTVTIRNPSMQAAKPYIRIYNFADVLINDFTIHNDQGAYAYIDCETEEITASVASFVDSITFSDSGFPVLRPGENTITLTRTNGQRITTVEIMPRWWKL